MKTEEIFDAADRITEEAVAASATNLVETNSLLIVTRSGILERTVPVAINRVPVTINQDIKALVVHSGVMVEYVAGFVRANEQSILVECSKAGTTVASIEFDRLKEYAIPLPPLPEQRRIVAKLDELRARSRKAREALDEVPALLEKLKQSVLAAAFRGDLTANWRAAHSDVEPASVLLQRIRRERKRKWEEANPRKKYVEPEPVDVEGLPELPEGWGWARVDQVGDADLGRQRSPEHHSGPHMRPYLRVANVFEDRIDISDVMEMNFSPEDYEYYRLIPGDILLNEGQSKELVGRPAMFKGEMPEVAFTNSLVRYRPFEGVDAKFALFLFRHYMRSGRFVKIAQITTNIAHLGALRFRALEFPVPPVVEQQEIVRLLEAMFKQIDAGVASRVANSGEIDRLDQSLLQKAFQGTLVPQDPQDETAEKLLARIKLLQSGKKR